MEASEQHTATDLVNFVVYTTGFSDQTDFIRDSKGRFTRYDFVACGNGLRQAHDMIYDCCVRQKKCRSILKHGLKRCGNRKSYRRPVMKLV